MCNIYGYLCKSLPAKQFKKSHLLLGELHLAQLVSSPSKWTEFWLNMPLNF